MGIWDDRYHNFNVIMFDEYHNCSHWKKQEHSPKSRLMMEDIDDDHQTDLYGHVCVAFADRALYLGKTLETKEIRNLCGLIVFLGKI